MKETGGPAFPQPAHTSQNGATGETTNYQWTSDGMTLRDYFAAHASDEDIADQMLNIAKVHTAVPSGTGMKYLVRDYPDNARQIARYRHADAMLEARK